MLLCYNVVCAEFFGGQHLGIWKNMYVRILLFTFNVDTYVVYRCVCMHFKCCWFLNLYVRKAHPYPFYTIIYFCAFPTITYLSSKTFLLRIKHWCSWLPKLILSFDVFLINLNTCRYKKIILAHMSSFETCVSHVWVYFKTESLRSQRCNKYMLTSKCLIQSSEICYYLLIFVLL